MRAHNYQELVQAPTLISLTAGKAYSYVNVGFKVKINDLVIVPNSGYNELPVVPAVVTALNSDYDLGIATRPILAVIPQEIIKNQENKSIEVLEHLQKRAELLDDLETIYEQNTKLQKFQEMAKSNPQMEHLLKKLVQQDKLLNENKD